MKGFIYAAFLMCLNLCMLSAVTVQATKPTPVIPTTGPTPDTGSPLATTFGTDFPIDFATELTATDSILTTSITDGLTTFPPTELVTDVPPQNVPVCSNDTCKNHGVCTPYNDTAFVCNCTGTGYEGQICNDTIAVLVPTTTEAVQPAETPLSTELMSTVLSTTLTAATPKRTPPPVTVCTVNPCKNSGKCTLHTGATGYTCDCSNTGFKGDNCDQKITACTNNHCKNNGVCQVQQGEAGYTCDCTNTGFVGQNCEEKAAPSQSSTMKPTEAAPQPVPGHSYTGAIVGIFLALIVAGVILFAFVMYRRRQVRLSYGRLDEDSENDSGWSAFSKNPIYRGDREYSLL